MVDILDQDGAAAPAALNLPIGHLFFGYKYVAPKSAEEEAEVAAQKLKKEPTFEGSGQTLRPPRKTTTTRGSGANSPSPSVVSSAGGTSRASTPAQAGPTPATASGSSEPKPDLVPFQGKGNTMR